MWLLALVLVGTGAIFMVQLGAVAPLAADAIAGALIGIVLFLCIRFDQRLKALEAQRPTPAQSSDSPATRPAPDTQAQAQNATVASPIAAARAMDETTPTSSTASRASQPPHSRGQRAKGPSSWPWRRWLLGENPAARAGVVFSLIGAALLVGYGVEQGVVTFSVARGLVLGGVLGVAAGVWGDRQMKRRPAFGQALQGGAVGLLFLLLFAAQAVYGLIGVGLAIGLLLLVAGAGVVQALRHDSIWLAGLALLGGLGAPLASGQLDQSLGLLFGYLFILNVAIAVIASRRRWRALNLLGLVMTGLTAVIYADAYYQAHAYPAAQGWLLAFWALYGWIGWRFAVPIKPGQRPWLDASLIFTPPLLGFGLQSQLLEQQPWALGGAALLLALAYGVAAMWRRRVQQPDPTCLLHAWSALAIGFLALAAPLALSEQWTALSWSVQGAAMVWVAHQQNQRWTALAGTALGLMALAALAVEAIFQAGTNKHLIDADTLVAIVVCSALAFSALQWHRRERAGGRASVPWAALLWLLAHGALWLWWSMDVSPRLNENNGLFALALLAGLISLPGAVLARRLDWRALVVPALLAIAASLLPAAARLAVGELSLRAEYGWLWAATLLTLLAALRVLPTRPHWHKMLAPMHLAMGWLLVLSLLGETQFGVGADTGHVLSGLMLLAVVWLVRRRALENMWPVRVAPESWSRQLAGSVLIVACLWLLAGVLNGRQPPFLASLPLINPLDLARLALVLTLAWIGLGHRRIRLSACAVAAWLGLSAATIRFAHHWLGAPLAGAQWLEDMSTQASLTVVWATTAVLTMLVAHHKAQRIVWLTGAALMGLTVAKLLLVDVAGQGTLARVVSFIGVGLLLLALGYLAPRPPAEGPAKTT